MPVVDTHPDYDTMLPKQERVRDALDADRVKAATTQYLPKLSGMEDADYDAYAKRGLFYGATSRTLQGVSGLVFRRETVTTLPANAAAEEIIADVNLRGAPLERFAQQTFDEVFAMGRVGVYVSLPTSATPGARAYLTRYRAESIVNWRVDEAGPRPQLSRVVLKEAIHLPDPEDTYKLKPVEQWRDIYLDENGLLSVAVWRKSADVGIGSTGDKYVAVEYNEPRFRGARLPMLPFVFVNARSLGPELEEPPLLPLADANLDHYRMMTDYRHGLHYTALPTPYVFGGTEDQELKIGSGTAWTGGSSDVTVGMLEFTGAGLSALKDAIESSVGYMASLGARLIEAEKNAAETAETHRLRQGREQATVAGTVQTLNDGLSQALTMALNLSGISGEAAVECNTDLVDAHLAPDELRVLVEAYQTGAIAFDTFYHNLRRGEMTRPGVEADEERQQIEVTTAQQMGALPAFEGDDG